jgi:hypothetical protein
MAGLVLIVLALFANYAATPEGAAMRALYAPKNSKIVIERSQIAGRYATVLTRGGLMESSPVNEPILVEHFSFGWQALDILNFRCRLDQHAISDRDKELLMRGMPRPRDDRPCRGEGRDAGPQTDVDAIREQMHGPLVPSAVISGNYALGDWYGGGGGQSLYKKSDGHWRLLSDGGGLIGVADMRKYGVPKSAWCALGIYGANCSRKP